ncbi:MAG: lysophospholipid acyltransferase family protein [Solirubrobacterales bacterium]
MAESKLKPQVYKDPRPAEYFTKYHTAARKGIGFTYEVVRMILTLPSVLIYRLRAIGVSNVPTHGACIVTPNHFSQMDHFFAAIFQRRKVQFMAKSQMFSNPLFRFVFQHGGVFPVRRGYHDQEAVKTANTVLDRGGCVLMYAEGGRSRSGELGKPKRGVGKLALENGVPVVPVAIHGSAGVRSWKKLRFPKVTVQYGEPIAFPKVEGATPEQQQEAADRVFDEVRRLYVALEEKGRTGVLKALREAVAKPDAAPAQPHSS